MVYSSNIRKQFQVKVEMKEEELFDDLEGEFVGDDGKEHLSIRI